MAYVTVDVDVDLDGFDDDELVTELKHRLECRVKRGRTESWLAALGHIAAADVIEWLREEGWSDLAQEVEARSRMPAADDEALKRWLDAVGAA